MLTVTEISCTAPSLELLGLCATTQPGLSQTFLPKETLSKWEHFLRMVLTGLWAERGGLSALWSLRDKCDPSSSPCPDLSRWAPLYNALTLVLQFVKETALISLTGHQFLNLIQSSLPVLKGYNPRGSNFDTRLSSRSSMNKLSNY